MTHKLIKTENYLLVVDDSEIKEDDWYKTPLGTYSQFNGTEKLLEGTKRVAAHLPLNGSPVLEGVDLLPPYSRHQEDGIDELAEGVYGQGVNHEYEEGFVDGYNKAREKYKYTEDDMKKAIDMARLQGPESFLVKYREEEIIQSLHQYPTEFISDDEISHEGIGTYSTDLMDIGVSNLKPIKVPKTITTAQGVQWVGKYK